jgi:hypothetical protein
MSYKIDSTRYKVTCFGNSRQGVITGLPDNLIGRWVALVAADDGCHLAALSQPAIAQTWEPEFDAMCDQQETLVIEFCDEIAGRKGKQGRCPDAVRLLEMAQALYRAERDDLYLKTQEEKCNVHK